MLQRIKVTTAVLIGNILDYYDFLLFAHFGPIITPYFLPDVKEIELNILNLFLFGAAFAIRPLGSIIFGYISDVISRKMALIHALRSTIFPVVLISFLPGFEYIGLTASCLFVILRLLQGFSLGGYTNAGTYLMEYHKDKRGLVSGILVASGTIGSLIGFGLSIVCMFYKEEIPWLWRVAFLLGGCIAFWWSFNMKGQLVEVKLQDNNLHPNALSYQGLSRWLTVFIGILVGTTNWLPATYTNFYVTKISNQPTAIGLQCTMIALVGYVFLSPIMGFMADKAKRHEQFMKITALCVVPLSISGFLLLKQGHYYLAQILLVTASSSFGAAIHPVMNSLFPASVRARNVSLLFTIGLSIGGLTPGLMSYFVNKTGLHLIPAFFISILATCMTLLFFVYEAQSSKNFLQLSRKKVISK